MKSTVLDRFIGDRAGMILGLLVGALVAGVLLARAEDRPDKKGAASRPAVKKKATPPGDAPAPAAAPASRPAPAASAPSTPTSAGQAGRLARLTPEAGARGWQLFFSKQCIRCHAIWGRGGQIGPDIGRARLGRLAEGDLAAELWNHIPRMWAKMEEERIPFHAVAKDEMEDLFAFFFFLRNMDEPGDARRGRLVMFRQGCPTCHELTGQGGKVGPDITRWSRYTNPVVWTQMMWQAAPTMQREMRNKGMTWPVFEGRDMVDMIAYIRSVSPSREKVYLSLGSPAEGEQLLRSKNCTACHTTGEPARGKVGPDLTKLRLPSFVAGAAVTLWNHAPRMLEKVRTPAMKPGSITPQEMAHIVSYLLALGYQDRPGDAGRGRALFKNRGCAKCHDKGTSSAPALAKMHAEGTIPYISHVMWNKSRAMLKEMTMLGLSWPTFSRNELLDILAYLRQAR